MNELCCISPFFMWNYLSNIMQIPNKLNGAIKQERKMEKKNQVKELSRRY